MAKRNHRNKILRRKAVAVGPIPSYKPGGKPGGPAKPSRSNNKPTRPKPRSGKNPNKIFE